MPDGAEQRLISDLVPRPDPTALTADAVATAKEDLRRELAQLREILEARMDAMDNNRRLLLQIMDERTDSIQHQFADLDARRTNQDQSRREALAAALESAKQLSDSHDLFTQQASEKFEAAIRDQIEQTAVLFQAGRERLDTKIDALKERLDRGEGTTAGTRWQRNEGRLDMAQVIAIVSVIVAIVAAVALIVKK